MSRTASCDHNLQPVRADTACTLDSALEHPEHPSPLTPHLSISSSQKTARPAAAASSSAAASTSAFYGRPAVACPIKAAGGGAGATAAWRRSGGGGGGGRVLRMAESETLEVTLKKPMGLVLEENVGGFGGLRVKEVADGGSAQVRWYGSMLVYGTMYGMVWYGI